MGFGLKNLKKTKEANQQSSTKSRYVRNIIVGDDLSSYLLLQNQLKNLSDSLLICSKKVNGDDFIKRYNQPLTFLRGQRSAEALTKVYTNLKLELETSEPLFYKDQNLRSFQGRSKPMLMLHGEELFTHHGYHFSVEDLFGSSWSQVDDIISKYSVVASILEIEQITPEDLVEPAYFKITLADLSQIYCEKIFWGRHPKDLIDVMKNAHRLDQSLHQFAYSLKAFSCLQVNFTLKEELSAIDNTVFIPQSLTHDWGHFVGRLLKKQASFTAILDQEIQSEEIAKKVRLLKKNIDRVFENFEKNILQEEIYVEDYFYVDTDQEIDQHLRVPAHLHLFGKFAVDVEQHIPFDFFAKSLLSVHENSLIS